MYKTAGRGILLFAVAAVLFSACGGRPDAVLVEDPYWSVVLRSTEKSEDLGPRIARLTVSAEGDAVGLLAEYLEEKKPSAVLLGAITALELQPLAERHDGIRFFVFDAPPEPPAGTPFIWVQFDPVPGLRDMAAKIRAYAERPVAFLDPETSRIISGETVFEGIDMEVVEILVGNSAEEVRLAVLEAAKNSPPVYLLFAGIHNAPILEILRQSHPAPVILDDRGGLSVPEGISLLFSLEKDYPAAIAAALDSGAEPGSILRVGKELR